ncbi:hypothetical protein [Sphingomonas immobilis]|uniref:Uncharacterized protein n=1 Tax=Sphingomonas immobilis TaxID=3063997 RepID=A0ABT9A424_9SPHN|nr:hypothetical protein [Sphingomonas sp. CA1-15]MDO7843487.1 hypothetical protein [Sphingomonas sp. CA1-15]
MSLIAAAMIAGAASLPAPPPGLQFSFYRMLAFQQRAHELNCGSGDLDAELADLRRKLIERYGKKAFSPPKQPASGMPGSCFSITSVYRVNLGDFRKLVAETLAAPAAPKE